MNTDSKTLPDYEDVVGRARIQGHHGGRAVVYAADGGPVLDGGYYVVDADENRTLVHYSEDASAAWPYGHAAGYDQAEGE